MKIKDNFQDYIHKNWDYNRAFSRNIGLVSPDEQLRLKNIRVGIPGVGGVGGSHLITLTRSGIGKFNIADFDQFEVENFNRQYGAFTDSIDKQKIDVVAAEAIRINPELDIKYFNSGITENNIDEFLKDVDVIVDGLDFFSIDIRRKLFARARQLGIYAVTAGPIGFGASLLNFAPDQGMSFDQYFQFKENDSEENLAYKFAIGLTPKLSYVKYIIMNPNISFKEKRGPSLALACQLCTGMAAAEVIKISLKRGAVKFVPHYFRFDSYFNKYYKGYLFGGNKNPLQKLKLWLLKRAVNKLQTEKAAILPLKPAGSELSIETLKYIAACGTLAPSGDNSQHWRMQLKKRSIILIEDKERSSFEYSVNNLAQYISYGAVAENISIAAGEFGLKTKVELDKNLGSSDEICKISFTSGGKSDPLAAFLEYRHTNRLRYNGMKVEQKKIDLIKSEAESIEGIKLTSYTGSQEMGILAKVALYADSYIWRDQMLHSDLFKWIRMDKNARDGMHYDVLGLDFHEKIILPYLKSWKGLTYFNKIGFNSLVGLKAYIQMRTSPVYFILSSPDNSLKSYFGAGRALSRFWIKANSLGLSLQPMTSSVMLFHKYLYKNSTCKDPVYEKLNDVYSSLFNIKENLPLMLFRAGYSNKAKARSPRRPIEDFIEIDN